MTSDRRCPICGVDLADRDPRTMTCSPAHRREAARVRRLLSGQGDGPYRTLGEYMARGRKVRANRPSGA